MSVLYEYKKISYLPFKHVMCFSSLLWKSPIQNPVLIRKRSSSLLCLIQWVCTAYQEFNRILIFCVLCFFVLVPSMLPALFSSFLQTLNIIIKASSSSAAAFLLV